VVVTVVVVAVVFVVVVAVLVDVVQKKFVGIVVAIRVPVAPQA